MSLADGTGIEALATYGYDIPSTRSRRLWQCSAPPSCVKRCETPRVAAASTGLSVTRMCRSRGCE